MTEDLGKKVVLPGHELLKLGASQVKTGPVGVSHRLVFRGSQVGQQGRHLVERSPAYSLVVPINDIMKSCRASGKKVFIHTLDRDNTTELNVVLYEVILLDLLLERYWPILSWLFHSRRWRASTLPSLIKDRLWLTESMFGESDAMSKKNLWWGEEYRDKRLVLKIKDALREVCHFKRSQWGLCVIISVFFCYVLLGMLIGCLTA